jgi:hypothetical protein
MSGLLLTTYASPARAACAPASGTQHQQLVERARGADAVFVGEVVRRVPAKLRDKGIFTPVTFRVVVFLHGTPARQVTVLARGGTIKGFGSEAVEDGQMYEGRGLQLVHAYRASDGAFLGGSNCDGDGLTTASAVRSLILVATHPVSYDKRFSVATPKKPVTQPRLPETGLDDLMLLLGLAGGSMLVGACAWGGAARGRMHDRRSQRTLDEV